VVHAKNYETFVKRYAEKTVASFFPYTVYTVSGKKEARVFYA